MAQLGDIMTLKNYCLVKRLILVGKKLLHFGE